MNLLVFMFLYIMIDIFSSVGGTADLSPLVWSPLIDFDLLFRLLLIARCYLIRWFIVVLTASIVSLLFTQLSSVDPLNLLLLLFLYLFVLLFLNNDLLCSDDLLHLLIKALIVKLHYHLFSFLLLKFVEFIDVCDQRVDDTLSLHVLAK